MQKALPDRLTQIKPCRQSHRGHQAWVSSSVNKSLNNMLDR